ncbi:MAG TPA: TonB-dependent receptor [Terriglobia bacterium]|nr:TonB-dependent receptor [Terriglobia bacterium]
MISEQLRGYVCFLFAALLLSHTAFSQVDQGRIVGTVRDASAAVVSGAAVIVKNERTGEERTTITSDQGNYTLPALKPSIYTVRATLEAFAPAEVSGIQLVVGQKLTLDLILQPASVSQEVTVLVAPEATVDTSSARIGANVDLREVGQLPINGRQLSQLYLQAPGSVNTGSGTFGDIRFSGRAVEQNAVRFDGIEGSAIVDASPGNLNGELASPFRLQSSLENVQEFRVDSNNYPAEYGTGTGGQVSVVTKSGSNQIHGALFEYLRNDAVDARNFFDLNQKSSLRLNQFGGSIGGPIKKDRIFFFGSYEGYRLRSGLNIVEAVPSAAAKLRAVPAVAPLIDGFRSPQAFILPGASTNPDFDIAQLLARNTVNENAAGLRLDFKLNDKHSLYTRFFRDQGYNDAPEGVSGRRAILRATPQNGVVALQSTLTSSLINEVKVGFNEALTRVYGLAPTVNGIDFSAITINVTGSIANNGISGQGASTGISIPGGLLRQNSAFNGRASPYTPYSLSFIDNFSWIRGNHNAKFGGELRMVRFYTDRQGGTTYTYSNLNDFLANRAQSVQYGGDLSEPSVFNGAATGQRLGKQEYYILYGQDEWKLSQKLTLNYGLRYEYYSPVREARNLNVQFDANTGLILPTTHPFFQALKTNFGPRVSLSWSPKSSTVVRGGFGMYYGPGQTEDLLQPIESDRISTTISNGAFPVDPASLRANFINNPNNRQFQPRSYSPDYRVPERIYQYSFSLQQQLPGNLVATSAYVGSQGRNLFLRNVTNRIVSVQTNADPTQNANVIRQFDIVQGSTILRPYAEIDYKTSGGHDSYNALQMSVVRRSANGLTLNSQYTFGKSWGNTAGSNEALTVGNPFDYEYDNGYNNFDVRHTFNASAVYALPFAKNNRILGGWEIGTIVNARSGLPVDMRITRPDVVYLDATGKVFSSPAAGRSAVINTPGGGSSRNVRRPDLIPGVNPYLDTDRAFVNPAAFAIPKAGTYGNLVRNQLHGPNFRQLDLMLDKRFRLTETTNFDFRAEVFNLFNMTNFRNPPATLPNALGTGTNQLQPGDPFTAAAAGTFGIMNSTVERVVGLGTNRQIQFALRLNF